MYNTAAPPDSAEARIRASQNRYAVALLNLNHGEDAGRADGHYEKIEQSGDDFPQLPPGHSEFSATRCLELLNHLRAEQYLA